jgi:cysteine-rich repeat protein
MKAWILFSLWVIFLFSCLFVQTRAAMISAASCSQEAVQAAINAAQDGDTVLVPNGSATWSTPIICNKAIVLRGAGIDNTTISDGTGTGWEDDPLIITTVGGLVTRVTGFTFDCQGSSTNGFMTVKGTINGRFRVDHNKFNNVASRSSVYRTVYGVIDNNIFSMPYSVTAQGISVFGDGNEAWNRPLTLGTDKAVYVENNIFNFDYVGDGALDAYGGARYVFRHNMVNGTRVGHHGLDSGGYRSPHSWEVYENVFTYPQGAANQRLFHSRGGTGVIYNNTYTGLYSGMHLANYRSCASYDPWGMCNGTNSFDGNEETNGYPCMDQNGRTTGQALSPVYAWENTLNGNPVGLTVVTTCGAVALHIVENRDFYNGMQKPGYTPYEYPHPLTAPVCGDGIKEGVEECDDGNQESSDGCGASCMIESTELVCGNSITEPGEACDGTDLNGYDCTTVAAGFASGALSCKADCSAYETSGCVAGNTITAASCSQVDVQMAVASAQDGDIVKVPTGVCWWTETLLLNKSIALKGAGIGKTIINDSTKGILWETPIIRVSGVGEKPFRISGFTFTNITGKAIIIATPSKNWRVDHCGFDNQPSDFGGYRYIFDTTETNTYGLVDHCNFTNSLVQFQNDDIPAWSRPLTLGTANAAYVEDNNFYYGVEHGSAEDFNDGEAGARIVVRYNNITNSHFHVHGNDGGSWRSTHSYEFYGNLMKAEGGINNYRFGSLRGGTGVVFNNNATGSWGPFYVVHQCLYREDCYVYPDGSFTQDCTIYPCTDQIGRTTDHDGDGVQDLVPLFSWDNYENSQHVYAQVQNDTYPEMSNIIKENRDFYNEKVTYDTERGVYSATYTDDDGSTKQWTYKPYVYPHPLTLIGASETHRSDINGNGCVELDEMISFMDRWKVSVADVSMPEIMGSIGLWKNGHGC